MCFHLPLLCNTLSNCIDFAYLLHIFYSSKFLLLDLSDHSLSCYNGEITEHGLWCRLTCVCNLMQCLSAVWPGARCINSLSSVFSPITWRYNKMEGHVLNIPQDLIHVKHMVLHYYLYHNHDE